MGEHQPNRCGGCQYGRRPPAAAGPVRGRKLQRAGLPGSDSEPRVLLEWAMGPAQNHFPYPYYYEAYQECLGERGCGERSRCRILRPSFPCRLWISRCSVRRVRSDWCLPFSEQLSVSARRVWREVGSPSPVPFSATRLSAPRPRRAAGVVSTAKGCWCFTYVFY